MILARIAWLPASLNGVRVRPSANAPAILQEYEYNIKVNEFLMYAEIEALFRGPKDKDSQTILYFTLRPNITPARDRRKFMPFPVKKERGSKIGKQNKRQIVRKAKPQTIRRARTRPKVRSRAKASKPASEL